MSEVALGDRIKVAIGVSPGTFDFAFAPVVFLPHARDNTREATFVTIETSGGHSISATEDHLLVATVSCSSSSGDWIVPSGGGLVEAGKISVGMCLRRSGGGVWEKVAGVRTWRGSGVHTVVTSHPSGLIVVDGFTVSSFGRLHSLTNLYYHMVRLLARVLPAWVLGMPILVATNQMLGGDFTAVRAAAHLSTIAVA
uniref:Hedgehog protein Hint domain-containing protein n=1 Tax=Lotharella oceanica TaxID=641309 RepID=A0A7S2THC2_9EUKA|mmetsp:Transcript_14274/g.27159  ORF Transcript_14274/g.27159 Transcript_14274/m.27159 type:complete len:197 (+) Transcript_14274:399-989(+)